MMKLHKQYVCQRGNTDYNPQKYAHKQGTETNSLKSGCGKRGTDKEHGESKALASKG